jgi:hypothetical protein
MCDKAEARFWAKVFRQEEGCWEWTGAFRTGGYGHLNVGGRFRAAHRHSWELHNGPIPEGMLVCHHCDNRKCVRPDHLFLGTYSDNALDREQKGRGRPQAGEWNPNKKLTEGGVWEILRRLANGESATSVSRDFGIGPTQTRRIRDGESWGHLTRAA